MLSKFKNKARVKELLEMANNVYYYKLYRAWCPW